jgi:glycosyltransferase involved in cell wall biosynthesis
MKIAILAPSPIPYTPGGVENLSAGLRAAIAHYTSHQVEQINVPVDERTVGGTILGYLDCTRLNLSGFDLVISLKYPTWAAHHPYHICYMTHRLRGVYDTYQGPDDWEALFRHRPSELGGPWMRRVVHWFDRRALDPHRICAYHAISRTVAARTEYFPPGIAPEVVYPPPLHEAPEPGGQQHFLVVGRFDGPKRIELAIEGYLRAASETPLLVVGEGPREGELRARAAGDPRVRFLGRVDPAELARLYADALAVIYTPYQEDYGYVTIEAFRARTPVITCSDSGGPLEFVRDGETGCVVDPDPDALAQAIARLESERAAAFDMGLNGQAAVREITWENVVARIVTPWEWLDEVRHPRKPGEPRRVLVLSPFSVHPPLGGGQARIWNLCRELARSYRVILACPGRHGEPLRNLRITETFTELRIPITEAHARELWRHEERLQQPLSDVLLPRLHRLTPNLGRICGTLAEWSDLIVTAHPYMAAVLPKRLRRKRIHDAVDAEFELKCQVLGHCAAGRRLALEARKIEARAVHEADLIIATSSEEGRKILGEYNAVEKPLLVAPNGVSTDRPRPSPEERRAWREELGLPVEQPVLLYLASWHPPNLAGLEFILETLAPAFPQCRFIVLGSVRDQLLATRGSVPEIPNVEIRGVVPEEEKNRLLSCADLAINPVPYGTGTNVKLLDYMAAALPIITTPAGLRGIAADHGVHLLVVEQAEFATQIRRCLTLPALVAELGEQARKLVEERYDWRLIAGRLVQEIERRFPSELPPTIDLRQEQQLLWGFHTLEHWPDGDHHLDVRWTAPRARFVLPAPGPGMHLLLEVMGAPQGSRIALFMDGEPLGDADVPPSWTDFEIPLPDARGRHESVFDLEASPWRPRESGTSEDGRILGVAVKRIALRKDSARS